MSIVKSLCISLCAPYLVISGLSNKHIWIFENTSQRRVFHSISRHIFHAMVPVVAPQANRWQTVISTKKYKEHYLTTKKGMRIYTHRELPYNSQNKDHGSVCSHHPVSEKPLATESSDMTPVYTGSGRHVAPFVKLDSYWRSSVSP